MTATALPARRLVRRLALAAVVAALLLPAAAVSPVAAATFTLRFEAGPQAAVRYDPATRAVTASKTVTFRSPVNATASARAWITGRGTWIKAASGPLSGWWVRESRVAYRPGIVASTTYAPARTAPMAAGRWELYRFDAAGKMTAAKGRTVPRSTHEHADRTAVINGLRYSRITGGAWAGWWLPGSVTAPARITCSAGSPPAGTAARIVRSVAGATGEIALTFDMGGRITPALDIVRFLELERVCATIFPTGAMAQTATGRAVLAEIRAHPELFELGNHTVHHCNLRDGGGGSACPAARPSAAFVAAELRDADAIIAGIAGRHTTPYWRPPFGALDTTLAGVAASAGYPYTIMWSTDTIDWRTVADGGPTASDIAAKVIAGRKAGAIVLMHLGGWNTRDALPAMVQGLRAAGYTPTTISALYR